MSGIRICTQWTKLDTEDPYGNNKRLAFCIEVIDQTLPQTVLDVGCGTGDLLTRPLAERFPAVRFIGLDNDEASLHYARSRPSLSNLTFANAQQMTGDGAPIDLIIASEVIEHVEVPEEFLGALRARLDSSGRLILTLPNGYGPFEFATLIEALVRASGLFRILRAVKRAVSPVVTQQKQMTLAASPHINFFSFSSIRTLIARSGFRILTFRPRTVLCGFGLDQIVTWLHLGRWNVQIADKLPAQFASDWMFVLAPDAKGAGKAFARGAVSRLRRSLNERAFGPG